MSLLENEGRPSEAVAVVAREPRKNKVLYQKNTRLKMKSAPRIIFRICTTFSAPGIHR